MKNFGSYVQTSKLKQSTMLVVGWRARQLDTLVCGFCCAKSKWKGCEYWIVLFFSKYCDKFDHFPGQAGHEGQWHESPGADPPYRLHSWGDGRRLCRGPNDVMGLFRCLLFSVQCCWQYLSLLWRRHDQQIVMSRLIWLAISSKKWYTELNSHCFVFACAAMVISASASAHLLLRNSIDWFLNPRPTLHSKQFYCSLLLNQSCLFSQSEDRGSALTR